MVVLLRPRQAPPGQAAGGLDSVVPGVSGSIVIQPTLSAAEDDTVLGLDPSGPRGSDTRVFPTALVPSTTNNNNEITPGPTSTPDQEGSREQKAKTSTLTVAIVAVAAFLIIAGGALLLFCRRSKDRRRIAQRRSTGGRQRGHWQEIETHQSQSGHGHGPGGGPLPPPIPMRANPFDDSHKAMDARSMYSTAHTIGTHFAHEPLMASNPFADSPTTASAPVPSLPTMPTIQHVQQPQQPLVQHHVDPHSGGFSAPSEYTASYIRSVYSATTDTSSVAESTATIITPRSRSNTLKRAPERDKNQHELIALDNLIAALDFNTDPQQGGSGGQQTLPDPSLFRAALGGGSSIGGHGGSSSRPHSPAPGSQQSHNAH